MALLTKQLVDEQIRESFSALTDLSSKYNVDTMRAELEQQITRLKQQEQIFLNAVNAETIEQVRQRISKYREDFPKIQNLNGPALLTSFLKPAEASMEYLTDERQRKFVDFFSKIPEDIVQAEDFSGWFQGILNSIQTSGRVRITSGYSDAKSVSDIVLRRLTAAQNRRIDEIISGKAPLSEGFSKRLDEIRTTLNEDSVSVMYTRSDWAALTEAQKESEIKDKLKRGEITDHQLNLLLEQLSELIISQGPAHNQYFRDAVREVIFEQNSKTKVFYGRNMLNGITGLLGEIQGLFFVKSLLGEAGNYKAEISWVGGIGNPHEDLILKSLGKMVGIQVKNSSKDIEEMGQMSDISFMTRAANSFEEVKKRLGAADYQDILSIYEMNAFNIEYVVENGIYSPGDNDEFRPSRENIEFLASEADRIMALFAGALMYMSVGEEFSSLEVGNSVYILGGLTMKLASEILIELFGKLERYEKEIGFKITSYFDKGANKIGNIADYFNANKGKHGSSVRNSLGQLFLQSSYSFSI